MSLRTYSNSDYYSKTYAAGRNNIALTTSDPNWVNVSLLLHGDGSNGANNATILDSSTNNYTITKNGSPAQGSLNPFTIPALTAYTPSAYTGSCYFSGADNVRITTTGITNWATSFTIECWVYPLAYPSASTYGQVLFGTNISFGWFGSSFYVTNNVSTNVTSAANAIPLNAWTHIACVSTASGTKIYANGVQIGSSANSYTTWASNSVTSIGSNNGTGQYFNGYISNLRVTNSEVYTGAFSPPTAPLSALAGTSLLLKFSNSAIYDSSVNNNLLVSGDTKTMVAINKFGGSSLYFDGTGDFISTVASKGIGNFGTSNFTLEAWWNSNNIGQTNYAPIASHGYTGSATTGAWALKIKSTTNIVQFTYHNGTALTDINGTSSVNDGQWHFIAIVRNGTSLYVFVDGVLQTTASVSTNVIGIASTQTIIGYQSRDASYINGYVDDLRITNGVARYTATFQPPSQPFPDF